MIWLMILPVALFVWTIIPLPDQTQHMRVNAQFVTGEQVESCPLLNRLLDYDFKVTLPAKVWQSQNAFIIINLARVEDSQTQITRDTCSRALETRLVLEDVTIQPGSTVIEPFIGADDQSFLFTINTTTANDAKGQLWIFADIYDASTGTSQHLPLFVVPVEIEVRSMLGLPPDVVRYVCLLCLLIILASWFRQRMRSAG